MPLDSPAALIDDVFSAIDAQDVERFLGFLTPGARFRFGSAPVVTGRDAIREAVGGFFASIAGLEHSVGKTLSDDTTLLCVGEVTYRRHDGSQVSLPFADSFELLDGAIDDYRIYIDIAPLYAA